MDGALDIERAGLRQHRRAKADLRVVIIGAGAGGIGAAIRLMQAGYSGVTILEKSGEVGGTWRDNTYPGAGCDVPSHLYSFSFAPKHDWSRRFAEQPEILDYLRDCARRFDLHPRIRFDTEVSEAAFDAASGVWRLLTADGRRFEAEILISAVGQLNRPHVPAIDGLDRFAGTAFHSARWRHDHALAGRRVAVIGTGPSAIQFIPRIAPIVGHLAIFQRSPAWVVPKPDRAYTGFEKALFRRFPWLARLHRRWIYLQLEKNFFAFKPGSLAAKLFERTARKELERDIHDPVLREKLRPDYPLGCKRIQIASDYYPALTRPNVEVVAQAIERIAPEGVITADGALQVCDTLIFATGFHATDFLVPMRLRGLDGADLNQVWRDGAEAHLGMTVAGFPNFFMLYGPNTNLGHNSIIFMIECQIRYLLGCLDALVDRDLLWLDTRRAAMDRFNALLGDQLARSVWSAGCSSWYKTASGRVTNNWSGFSLDYWWRTRRPDLGAFQSRARA